MRDDEVDPERTGGADQAGDEPLDEANLVDYPDPRPDWRFSELPAPVRPEDLVAIQEVEPSPWQVYTAPDVGEEQARRWGLGG